MKFKLAILSTIIYTSSAFAVLPGFELPQNQTTQDVTSSSESSSKAAAVAGASSGSTSSSSSGNVTTNGGSSTAGSSNSSSSSGPSTTNGGQTSGIASGNIDTSNKSQTSNKTFALSVHRSVVGTLPMRCVKSSAWSVDVLIVGGSKSTSEDDPYCIRQNLVQQVCASATAFFLDGDLKEYVKSKTTAAKLECSDIRINGAFESKNSCVENLEASICPMPIKQVSSPIIAQVQQPREIIREVVRIERVEVPVYVQQQFAPPVSSNIIPTQNVILSSNVKKPVKKKYYVSPLCSQVNVCMKNK